MRFLDEFKPLLERTSRGTLRARIGEGEEYDDVSCVPLFPLSDERRFISLVHKPEKEVVEIGIIRSLEALSSPQRKLVEEEVRVRYFMPEIRDVSKVTGTHGIHECEVATDRGPRTLSVRHRKENVKVRDDGVIVITDSDMCRYRIRSIEVLSVRARKELEKLLP